MKRLFLLTVLVLVPSCGRDDGEGPLPSSGRPVILISVDCLRADHCTPYGYEARFTDEPTTPFLQRLAEEGVLFEEAESSTCWTLPAHVSLLTGMDAFEHGVRNRLFGLAEGTEHLAGRFQRAGYATAGFFSGPFLHPEWGFGQGFDTYEASSEYLRQLEAAAIIQDTESRGRLMRLHNLAHADRLTSERVVDLARQWLAEDDRWKEPFFLFLHLWDPHYDYAPPPELAETFLPDYDGPVDGSHFIDRNRSYSDEELSAFEALYDAEVRYTDGQIERLFRILESWGIADEALFVVTADHGEAFGEHGERGHQKNLYEEVTHIPMILRAPGLLPEGKRIPWSVPLYDLAPTLLELTGVPVWKDRRGQSLLPMIFDREPTDRSIVLDLHHHTLQAAWKRAWRRGRYKVHWDLKAGAGEIYDLEEDPGELDPIRVQQLAEHPLGERAEAELRARGAFEPVDRITRYSRRMKLSPAMETALDALGYAGSSQD